MAAPTLGGDYVTNTTWAQELMALPENWDSYKSPRIAMRAIATVGQFATVPTCDGGVQLEIHRDGWDIEIGIGADGRIEDVNVSVCKT